MRNKRKRKYRESKRRAKEVIEESKRKADEDFGRRLSEKFKEDKRSYWKEVKGVREKENGGNEVNEVKDKDGKVLKMGETVKRRWKDYFEDLMSVNSEGDAKENSIVKQRRSRPVWEWVVVEYMNRKEYKERK